MVLMQQWTLQNALARSLSTVGPQVPTMGDKSILQVKPVLRFAPGPRLQIEVS